MASFRYFSGAHTQRLLIFGLLLIAADIMLRVWVSPAAPASAGDQTEQALSQPASPDARLASPFDPFYAEVATRFDHGEDEAGELDSDANARLAAYDYRVLAVSEVESGQFRTVIQMSHSAGESTTKEQAIETLTVGDTIGDARVTAISGRGARLESASLGTVTLTLFLPAIAPPENGPVPSDL